MGLFSKLAEIKRDMEINKSIASYKVGKKKQDASNLYREKRGNMRLK